MFFRWAFSTIFWGALSLFFSLGCSDQSKGLKNEVKTRHDINTSRQECQQVDFHRDSLKKSNLLLGVECLGFGDNYAPLKNVLENSPGPQFNELMSPFNKAFFSGTKARTRALEFFSKNMGPEVKAEIKAMALEAPKLARDFKLFTRLKSLGQDNKQFIPGKEAIEKLHEFYRLSKSTAKARGQVKVFLSTLLRENREGLAGLSSEALHGLLDHEKRAQFEKFLAELNFLGKNISVSPGDIKKLLGFVARLEARDLKSLSNFKLYLEGSNELRCMRNSGLDLQVEEEFHQQMDALTAGDEEFLRGLNALFIKVKFLEELCDDHQETGLIRQVLSLAGEFFQINGSTELVRAFSQSGPEQKDIFNFFEGGLFLELRHFLKGLSQEEIGKLSTALHQYMSSYNAKARASIAAGLAVFGRPEVSHLLSELGKSQGFPEYFMVNVLAHEGAPHGLELAKKVLRKWPSIIYDLQQVMGDPSLYELLTFWGEKLNDAAVFSNIQAFILSEDMQRLFNLFFGKKPPLPRSDEKPEGRPPKERPLILDLVKKRKTLQCLRDLTQSINDRGLLDFSQGYSRACEGSLKDDMSSKLIIYASESNRAFRALFNRDLFIGSGVFSPELLNLYVSTLLIWADLENAQSREAIQAELVGLKKAILAPSFLSRLEKGVSFVANSEKAQELIGDALLYISKMRPEDLRAALSSFFSAPPPVERLKAPGATVASPRTLGQENETPFGEIDNKKRLASHLIDFFSPNVGTEIGAKGDLYKFSLKEGLLLVHDLTGPDSLESVYHYKNGVDVAFLPMHLSERLETTIWDISFLNNFYGAYFINRIAMSDDYLEEVAKLKKNVRALDVGEGLFRRIGVYPQKTLWAFKNIYNTYDSLIEIGKKRFGPEKRSYKRPAQALLKRLVLASPARSRDFSPYRRPNLDLVQGHAAVLLSKIAQEGLLTKASLFLRNNFSEEFQARLEGENFKEINRLYQEIDFQALKPLILDLLTDDHFYELLKVSIASFRELGPLEQELALSRALSALNSFLKFTAEDQAGALRLLKAAHPFFRANSNIDLMTLLEIADKYAKILSSLPHFLASLSEQLSGLMVQRENAYVQVKSFNFQNEVIKGIIERPQFPTHSVIESLRRHHEENHHFNYYIDVIKLLASSKSGRTNLEASLLAVFKNSEREISEFLLDIINKISIRPPYTLSE